MNFLKCKNSEHCEESLSPASKLAIYGQSWCDVVSLDIILLTTPLLISFPSSAQLLEKPDKLSCRTSHIRDLFGSILILFNIFLYSLSVL
jgi:hypothetical protein